MRREEASKKVGVWETEYGQDGSKNCSGRKKEEGGEKERKKKL